jgi:hypothetical protein
MSAAFMYEPSRKFDSRSQDKRGGFSGGGVRGKTIPQLSFCAQLTISSWVIGGRWSGANSNAAKIGSSMVIGSNGKGDSGPGRVTRPRLIRGASKDSNLCPSA